MPNPTGFRSQITQEKLDLIEKAFDDGWSAKDIRETYKVGNSTIQRYFRGRPWSPKQIQEHQTAIRRLNKS